MALKKVWCSLRRINAFLLPLWAILFIGPQFITDFIFQQQNILFAFTGFYWLLHFGILMVAFLFAWKYDHPITQIGGIIFSIFTLYLSFRYLQPSLWILNPTMFVFNVILTVILGFQSLLFLGGTVGIIVSLVNLLIKQKLLVQIRQYTRFSYKTWGILSLILLWGGLLAWSYVGFSQTYLVQDQFNSNFRVSFWGIPSMGFTFDNYNTPDADEELALYQQLNSCFIFTAHRFLLDPPNLRANVSAILHELEAWGLEFICDCTPIITFYNESNDKWVVTSDYVTYYYTAEVNTTIDLIMEWVQAEGFTNFRGISLDIEGPQYSNSSKVISKGQYEFAKQSFSAKFAEFQAAYPGKIINGISMEGTMWDPLDGDYDLDVRQLTISNELNLDIYGYMTYHTGSASFAYSDYRYLSFLQYGVTQHAEKFQPWVGWWYDPISTSDPNVIENPAIYSQTLRQFKIAKSMGVNEVVLAPLRNFLGLNITEGRNRLQDLIEIKTNGFESFKIPITNNMRLVLDFPYWWKKIHPTYWVANDDIFQDLLMGTDYNWIFWLEVGITAIFCLIAEIECRTYKKV